VRADALDRYAEVQLRHPSGLCGQQALFDPPQCVVDGEFSNGRTLGPASFSEDAALGGGRFDVLGELDFEHPVGSLNVFARPRWDVVDREPSAGGHTQAQPLVEGAAEGLSR
jgi:hypothetical protein